MRFEKFFNMLELRKPHLKTKSGFSVLVPRGSKIKNTEPLKISFEKKYQLKDAKKGKKYIIPFCRGENHIEIMKKDIVLIKDYDITPEPFISGEIIIDYSKIMKFKLWTLTNDEKIKETFEIDFDLESQQTPQEGNNRNNSKNDSKDSNSSKYEKMFDPIPIPEIKLYIEKNKNKKEIFRSSITAENIRQAYNRKEIIEFLLESIINKKYNEKNLKNAIVLLLGDIIAYEEIRQEFPDLVRKIVLDRVSFLKYVLKLISKEIKNKDMFEIIRYSIELIGKSKNSDTTNEITYTLFEIIEKKGDFSKFIGLAFVSLGKIGCKKEILEYYIKYWDLYSNSSSSAISFVDSCYNQIQKAHALKSYDDQIFQIIQKATKTLINNKSMELFNSIFRIYRFSSEKQDYYIKDIRYQPLITDFQKNLKKNLESLEIFVEQMNNIQKKRKDQEKLNRLKEKMQTIGS